MLDLPHGDTTHVPDLEEPAGTLQIAEMAPNGTLGKARLGSNDRMRRPSTIVLPGMVEHNRQDHALGAWQVAFQHGGQ